MTLEHTAGAPTGWDALPETIRTYLTAHAAGEGADALPAFTADAVVTDEGRDHTGRAEIESFLTHSASEFTFTTEFVSAAATGADAYDVVQHLEGDFPGGVADLHFRFRLDGGLISRLQIEP